MKPIVSIITPSYNQGCFIEETIKSVLAQDYKNIEYLIIDGGSSDNTVDIIKRYNSKLKWISEKDEGQADAINKGIKMSKGEIIYWLNSDDTLLPGVITNVIECFLRNPTTALVYGKSFFIDSNGKTIGNVPFEPFIYETFAVINYIPQPSAFFKREVYNVLNGFDTSMHYAFDYDLWIRIAQKFDVTFIPEYLSCYRLHKTSKTVSKAHALDFDRENLETVIKYYNRAPVNRLYVYSYSFIESRYSISFRPAIVFCSLLLTCYKYFKINKQIRLEDIRYIKLKNIKKLFVKIEDIYKFY